MEGLLASMACIVINMTILELQILSRFLPVKKFVRIKDGTVSPEKKNNNILAHSAMLLSVGDAERSLNKKFFVY